jgi:hypothetical protein
MPPLKQVALIAFVLAPVVALTYVRYRLAAYRRDRGGFLWAHMISNWRILRPDLYTDEGQPLLRLLWVLTILTIPYILLVVAILG